MRNLRISVLLSMAMVVTCSGGCMSTKVLRVARFAPAGPAAHVHHAAPTSAAYRVKYADSAAKGLRTVGGTRRVVARGEPLGFVTADDGTLFAVAGAERIPLDNLPPSARYCVWTAKQERPTQFTREVGKAVTTGVTAAAVGVVVGAAIVGEAYLNSDDDDCDVDTGRHHHHRHQHRDRSYRWVGPEAQTEAQKSDNP